MFKFTFLSLSFSLGVLASANAQVQLPLKWHGTWKGSLHIYTGAQVKMELPMSLEIYPIASDSLAWIITYYSKDSVDRRNYHLLQGAGQNHFIMDEKNGIFLDAFLNSETLYSDFLVGESRLQILYTHRNDAIEFLVFTTSKEPLKISGGDFKVETFKQSGFQKALLRKEN